MSELRKANTDHAYFLTMTVIGWIDVFNRPIYAEEILKSLQFSQQRKSLEIYAYVLMSNHLHLVCRRREGLLSEWIRDFKSFTAKTIIQLIEQNPLESRKDWMLRLFEYHARHQQQHATYMFWQKTNHPVELSSAFLVRQKIDYIHLNPVRAGVVYEPYHYVYSSANPASTVKVLLV